MSSVSHGLKAVKVIALAVTDMARAQHFYGKVLGLDTVSEHGEVRGYALGDLMLMLKDDWYGKPTAEPNPRLTILCDYAPDTEAFLRERNVTIADPVVPMEEYYLLGSFLDSEGNKLWFCSANERP
ncbi:VOC family protein [Shewanella cyperi]|uniref:VOC family protein n=1 Tax=Shewanella cyperi TaxID=2814292 RepID=UPI001A93EB84|nr:VOC family protein [Shewanella cyperi]QSX41822.1 VOC family protein [Shewanella cyperi]